MFKVIEVKFVLATQETTPRVVKKFDKRMAAKEYADQLNRKHDLASLDCITNYYVKECKG